MRSLYIFFFLFVSLSLSGQHTFQRTYEISDRLLIHGGMAVAGDGGFYLVSTYPELTEGFFKFHVTKHHFKGDILWSYDYELEGYGNNVDFDMDIAITSDTSVVVVATELNGDTGGVETDLIFKISSDGEPEWSKTIDSESANAFAAPGQISLRQNYNDGILVASLNSDNEDPETNTYLSSINNDGETDWSKVYKILDADGVGGFSLVTAIDRSEIDTTFMITGLVDSLETNDIFLSKVTQEGEMLWSRSYLQMLDNDGAGINNQVLDIACANDTTTIVTGLLTESSTGLLTSYVFKVDKDGLPLWSKTIQLPGTFPITLNTQVVADADNNIILAGRYIDVSTGDLQDYVIRLNALGQLIWSKQFPKIDSYVLDPNLGLLTGGDLRLNGTEYMLSGVASNLELGNLYPFVVRIDQEGSAVCEVDAMASINDTLLTFSYDTLLWASEDFVGINDFMIDRDTFMDYDLPMVTLLDTFFCPQDPIMVTLDATADYAETYEWSTGETTPMIDVTEDGEYMVTVTFDTLACFTLCDTSVITKLEFPDLGIAGNNSEFCETGDFILEALPSMGLPPFSYAWSTGETSQLIRVNQFGEYSVVVTDECGNSASETINYSESNLPMLTVDGNLDSSVFCSPQPSLSGTFGLAVVPSGGVEPYFVMWSTGQTSRAITVDEIGTYDVTISDSCGEMIVESFTITESDIPEPAIPMLSFDPDSFCIDGSLIVTLANPLDGFSGIQWSNGVVNAEEIVVDQVGVYTIEAESCNQAVSASIDISESLPMEGLQFPNMFMPGQQDTPINQTFGPLVECPSLIDSYEMKIFNRWGKMVFETDNVESRWNGAFDGKRQPSQVFFWFARYTEPGGVEVTVEGDVSLVR